MLRVRTIGGLRSLETRDCLVQHACLLCSHARSRLESCVGRPQLRGAQIRLRRRRSLGGLQRWLNCSERASKMRACEDLLHIRIVWQCHREPARNKKRFIEPRRSQRRLDRVQDGTAGSGILGACDWVILLAAVRACDQHAQRGTPRRAPPHEANLRTPSRSPRAASALTVAVFQSVDSGRHG